MRLMLSMLGIWAILAAGAARVTGQTLPAKLLPQDKIEEVLAHKGALNERGTVLKVQWTRPDVSGAQVRNRVSFQVGKRKPAIMAGEIALLAHEVNPMLAALVENDVSVTALHTQSLDDAPRVFVLHFDAEGDAVLMAAAVRKGLEAIKSASARPKRDSITDSSLSATALDRIFDKPGKLVEGRYELEIPHSVEMPCGCLVSADMGVRTLLAFSGTDDRAQVEGDIACVAGQLQRTLKALAQAKIDVTSITNHMELEAPRTIYVHLAAIGKPADLAKAIKPALTAPPVSEDAHEHHHE